MGGSEAPSSHCAAVGVGVRGWSACRHLQYSLQQLTARHSAEDSHCPLSTATVRTVRAEKQCLSRGRLLAFTQGPCFSLALMRGANQDLRQGCPSIQLSIKRVRVKKDVLPQKAPTLYTTAVAPRTRRIQLISVYRAVIKPCLPEYCIFQLASTRHDHRRA